MEEKRSIKRMAFLIIVIANIVLLIAVITSVAKAVKNIEPGMVSQISKDESIDGEYIEEDFIINGESQEELEESQETGIGQTIKNVIKLESFNLYKLLEIGLFVMGIFLFLVGIFILRAVKRL